jgi:ParB family transcriptional regulator, chromosome partitioning protein
MGEKTELDRLIELDPATLLPNPYQVRTISPSDPTLDELVESVRKNGLIEPPIVRQTLDGYQIATGHRRVAACIRAGLKEIRCILRDYNDEQMAVAGMEENLKRKSFNPIEEARGYANLRDYFHYTEEKNAATFQTTRDHVAQSLRLLKFQQPIQDLVAQGQLAPSHAEAIAMAPTQSQLELAQTVVNKKLSVKTTTEMAKELVSREKAKQEALDNIDLRLGGLDTQVANLKARIDSHQSQLTKLEFHEYPWKAEDCRYNIGGFCDTFSWQSIPPDWARRLEGIAQFKMVDGKARVQACSTVCAYCSFYRSRKVSNLKPFIIDTADLLSDIARSEHTTVTGAVGK